MTEITVTKEEMTWLEKNREEMVYDGREWEIVENGAYTYTLSGDQDALRDMNDQLNWYGPNNTGTHSRY